MTREGLTRAGVDYDSGARRFAGKTQLYEKYLLKFFENNSLFDLRCKLETGDYEAAFRIAHSLKGVSGNLSMGPLYDTIAELVEYLRAGGRDEEALRLCERAMELYHAAEKAVKE